MLELPHSLRRTLVHSLDAFATFEQISYLCQTSSVRESFDCRRSVSPEPSDLEDVPQDHGDCPTEIDSSNSQIFTLNLSPLRINHVNDSFQSPYTLPKIGGAPCHSNSVDFTGTKHAFAGNRNTSTLRNRQLAYT
jgi:hypothetical protein